MNLPYSEFLGHVADRVTTRDSAFSEVLDDAGMEIPTHTHDHHHFQMVIAGVFVTGARQDGFCGPGALIFNPAGTTHRDRFHLRGGRFLAGSISGAFLGPAAEFPQGIERARVFEDSVEAWLGSRMLCELRFADTASASVLDSLLIELLDQVAHGSVAPAAAPPSWLRRAVEQIEDQPEEPLRVAAVAAAAGVHPFHLTRTFRRFFRCTAGEYLRRVRVKRACGLLRGTSHSIARTAVLAGFADQSELTKVLRRYTGFTPARYRLAFH
jgi:AraC family transcriptional regulator